MNPRPLTSSRADRRRATLDVFDFHGPADMAGIAALETGTRVGGQDPATHEEY